MYRSNKSSEFKWSPTNFFTPVSCNCGWMIKIYLYRPTWTEILQAQYRYDSSLSFGISSERVSLSPCLYREWMMIYTPEEGRLTSLESSSIRSLLTRYSLPASLHGCTMWSHLWQPGEQIERCLICCAICSCMAPPTNGGTASEQRGSHLQHKTRED